MKRPRVIIFDGNNLMYRQHHFTKHLTSSFGHPTGVMSALPKHVQETARKLKATPILVFDGAKGSLVRKRIYANYKSNRNGMPEELAVQLEPVKEIMKALGVAVYHDKHLDADDVIGTLAHNYCETHNVIISSLDKDFNQLVTSSIRIWNPQTRVLIGKVDIEKRYGITPNQFVDYLALVGDTVDGIPGVYKCGPVTASEWLAEFGDCKTLVKNAPEKIKKRIDVAQLKISYKLAKINTTLDLPDIETKVDAAKVKSLLKYYELRQLLNMLIIG